MTSCSLACSKHASKLKTFLALFFDAELETKNQNRPQVNNALLQAWTDLTMHRIKSLSNHEKIINIPRSDRERQMSSEDDIWENNEFNPQHSTRVGNTRVPRYMMELQVTKPDMPEEFNMKVFKLIDMALDDTCRSQVIIRYCPWF